MSGRHCMNGSSGLLPYLCFRTLTCLTRFRFFAYQHKYEDELLSIQYGGLLPRTTGMIGKKTRRRKESKKERIARQDKEKRTTGNVDGGVVKHSESSPSVRRENANTLEEFIESVESDLAGLTVASATSELDIDSDDEASSTLR